MFALSEPQPRGEGEGESESEVTRQDPEMRRKARCSFTASLPRSLPRGRAGDRPSRTSACG